MSNPTRLLESLLVVVLLLVLGSFAVSVAIGERERRRRKIGVLEATRVLVDAKLIDELEALELLYEHQMRLRGDFVEEGR